MHEISIQLKFNLFNTGLTSLVKMMRTRFIGIKEILLIVCVYCSGGGGGVKLVPFGLQHS